MPFTAGSWCSGITSASHAEGPGFKSQWVHFTFPISRAVRHRGYNIRRRNSGFVGLVVMTLASHARGPRFDPGRVYFLLANIRVGGPVV